jgi:hypothetical protein
LSSSGPHRNPLVVTGLVPDLVLLGSDEALRALLFGVLFKETLLQVSATGSLKAHAAAADVAAAALDAGIGTSSHYVGLSGDNALFLLEATAPKDLCGCIALPAPFLGQFLSAL